MSGSQLRATRQEAGRADTAPVLREEGICPGTPLQCSRNVAPMVPTEYRTCSASPTHMSHMKVGEGRVSGGGELRARGCSW